MWVRRRVGRPHHWLKAMLHYLGLLSAGSPGAQGLPKQTSHAYGCTAARGASGLAEGAPALARDTVPGVNYLVLPQVRPAKGLMLGTAPQST